ncbi:MAG: reprolysin-like metallopeptidase [Chloroflexota bacterium]
MPHHRRFILALGLFFFILANSWFSPVNATDDPLTAPLTKPVALHEHVWTDVGASVLRANGRSALSDPLPRAYHSLSLNVPMLQRVLEKAPHEFTREAERTAVILTLPLPSGENGRFRIVESPIMAAGLAQKFPSFKTYSGVSLDGSHITTRLSWTANGFHAAIVGPNSLSFVAPYSRGNVESYIAYDDKDDIQPIPFQSENDYIILEDQVQDYAENNELRAVTVQRAPTGDRIKVLRTAIAGPAEYTASEGGTVEGGLAAIVNHVNVMNVMFERELALRLELVANNDQIIFTDPATDPYTDYSFAENATALNTYIGTENYDLGHFLTNGGGGVAVLGAICNGSKASGKSGDHWRVIMHEMGHQLNALHTQNSPNCGGGGAEVGSGVTIMSYAGVCGGDNIVGFYSVLRGYHVSSYDQMNSYLSARESCGYWLDTGNTIPVVDAGDENRGLTIPANTPFRLEGSATDGDGDDLTYSWDQYDFGPAGHPNEPVGNAPIFRAFATMDDTWRIFPQLSDVVNNSQTFGELLPSYSRNLHMRLTVRDNRGGVAHDDIDIGVVDTAGPFRVLFPNSGESWQVGEEQMILWDVADTDVAPVMIFL